MYKVEKVLCVENFEVIAEKRMTFTDGKIYYTRRSKKGNLVIKSNEGEWTVVHPNFILGSASGKFRLLKRILFENLKDYKHMSF